MSAGKCHSLLKGSLLGDGWAGAEASKSFRSTKLQLTASVPWGHPQCQHSRTLWPGGTGRGGWGEVGWGINRRGRRQKKKRSELKPTASLTPQSYRWSQSLPDEATIPSKESFQTWDSGLLRIRVRLPPQQYFSSLAGNDSLGHTRGFLFLTISYFPASQKQNKLKSEN